MTPLVLFTVYVFCAYPPGIPDDVAERMTTTENPGCPMETYKTEAECTKAEDDYVAMGIRAWCESSSR
jgi:hypothetical protein